MAGCDNKPILRAIFLFVPLYFNLCQFACFFNVNDHIRIVVPVIHHCQQADITVTAPETEQ